MNKIKLVIFFISILFGLNACSTTPKNVYLPIPVKYHPVLPNAPIYPQLAVNSTPADFVKWCIIGRKECMADNNYLRTVCK